MILSSGGINVNHHFFNSQQYENCNKKLKKKVWLLQLDRQYTWSRPL